MLESKWLRRNIYNDNGRRMGGELDLLHVFVFLLFSAHGISRGSVSLYIQGGQGDHCLSHRARRILDLSLAIAMLAGADEAGIAMFGAD